MKVYGLLDCDVESRKIIRLVNASESPNARERHAALTTGHFSSEPAALKRLHISPARPTNRGQAHWVARCVPDYRDQLRKAVPRTHRKEVNRHKGYAVDGLIVPDNLGGAN